MSRSAPRDPLVVGQVVDPERIDLSGRIADLDAGERERHDSYRRDDDRRRHLVSHLVLRDLLADRLALGAAEVRLGRDPCPLCGDDHGRPVSLDDPAGTHFSIAHAVGRVVVAVSDRTVGVDIEPRSRASADDALDSALHPRERALIGALDPTARADARLACWVRTEAVLKARGTGLGVDPATVACGPVGGFDELPGGSTTVGELVVLDLDVGPVHLAALAIAVGDEPDEVAAPSVRTVDVRR